MRVFLAGATGVIGRRLLPMLIADGHRVTGMTRTPEKASVLQAQGADAVVADALDAEAVRDAVRRAEPEAVIHQLTALPARIDPRKMERDFVLNDRLRGRLSAIRLISACASRSSCVPYSRKSRVRSRSVAEEPRPCSESP